MKEAELEELLLSYLLFLSLLGEVLRSGTGSLHSESFCHPGFHSRLGQPSA